MKYSILQIATDYLGVFTTKSYQLKTRMDLTKLSIEESYQIQQVIIGERVARGERVVGYKVGCTSKSIQQQFGLVNPIRGFLTEPNVFKSQAKLKSSSYVNLAIEPEFVIRLSEDVTKEFLQHHEMEKAIATVAAGIELHNFKFCHDPTSQELIILNGLHAGVVIGEEAPFDKHRSLSLEGLGVFVNGELVASGIGAEIMGGGPIQSLEWLAHQLLETGNFLKRGDLVIPGSPVKLISLKAGDHAKVTITNWGTVEAFIE